MGLYQPKAALHQPKAALHQPKDAAAERIGDTRQAANPACPSIMLSPPEMSPHPESVYGRKGAHTP
jgi:hypothetical protein